MRINARLVKGLSEEDRDRFEKEYQIARKVLLKIRNEVEKEIQKSYLSEEQLEDISVASVAKLLGYRRGLREVLTYLPEE